MVDVMLMNSRYHGANTPSAWLTSYRLAGDNRLDRFGIEDGIWRKVTSWRDGKDWLVLNRTKDELKLVPAYNNTDRSPSEYRGQGGDIR
jgi:hypothetical protein